MNQDDAIGNEEELFGPIEPIAPLSPLGPLEIDDRPTRPEGLLADFHGGLGAEDMGEDGGDKKDGKEKKPRKLRMGNLNEARLCGKDGLRLLPKNFEGVKFRDKKGFEKEDLALLLGKIEEWAHLMTPRRQFIDVVERLEFLGTKKAVKGHAMAVKRGEEFQDEDAEINDEPEEERSAAAAAGGNNDGNTGTQNNDNSSQLNNNAGTTDILDGLLLDDDDDFGDIDLDGI